MNKINNNSIRSIEKWKTSSKNNLKSFLNIKNIPVNLNNIYNNDYYKEFIKKPKNVKAFKHMNNKIFWDKEMNLKYKEIKSNSKINNKNSAYNRIKWDEIDNYIKRFITKESEIETKNKSNKNYLQKNKFKLKNMITFKNQKKNILNNKIKEVEDKFFNILTNNKRLVKNQNKKKECFSKDCYNIIKDCYILTNDSNKTHNYNKCQKQTRFNNNLSNNKSNKENVINKYLVKKNVKFLKFIIKSYNK